MLLAPAGEASRLMGCLATAQRPSVFWFGPRIRWSSAFRLVRAADMLKHELQRLSFVKEKTLATADRRIDPAGRLNGTC
jgi:hypothetical protein